MKVKNLPLLLFLSLLWGPSFLLIKVAVSEIPPITLAILRLAIAAVVLNVFFWLKGNRLPVRFSFWKHVTIAGLFANAIPFVLISWGEMYINSATAAILNGLTPLFTIVLANFFITDDKMTPQKIVGVIIGFVGLLVLVLPNFSGGESPSFWGIMTVSAASLSYGVGMVYSRLKLMKEPPLYAPAGQLLSATVLLLPLVLVMDEPLQLTALSLPVVAAVLSLGVLGTALAYVVYYKVLEKAGASYLSLVTYLMPVYGMVLGILFLNESLSTEAIIGATIILLALGVVNRAPKGTGKEKQHAALRHKNRKDIKTCKSEIGKAVERDRQCVIDKSVAPIQYISIR